MQNDLFPFNPLWNGHKREITNRKKYLNEHFCVMPTFRHDKNEKRIKVP